MTLREINDICIAKINGTIGEAEIPKEFWENVGRLANDLVDQEWREKQIPKKPINVIYDGQYIEYWNCPHCHIQHSNEFTLFCDNCGQSIDCPHKDE